MSSPVPTVPSPEPSGGLQRRTIIGAAAWAAPAIAMSVASPAAAASRTVTVIRLDVPGVRTIEPGEKLAVSGWIELGTGLPMPDHLTIAVGEERYLSAPTQVPVAPDGTFSFEVTALVTDTQTHGTYLILTSSSNGYQSVFFSVTPPTNVGEIAITSTPDPIRQGESGSATGKVTASSPYSPPSRVSVSSSAPDVATVPETVEVAADGTFSLPVTAVAASGTTTITVSADGFGSATFTATAVAAGPRPGTFTMIDLPTVLTVGSSDTVKGQLNLPEGVDEYPGFRLAGFTLTDLPGSKDQLAHVVWPSPNIDIWPGGVFMVGVTAGTVGTTTLTLSAPGYESFSWEITVVPK